MPGLFSADEADWAATPGSRAPDADDGANDATLSAAASSPAVEYRSSGSRASALLTMPSRSAGSRERSADAKGGGSVNRLTKPSLPTNGGLPVSIS